MRRFLHGLLGLVCGYAVGAAIGAALVALASSNTHDRSLEMAMTAIFFTGPIGAVIGAAAAIMRAKR